MIRCEQEKSFSERIRSEKLFFCCEFVDRAAQAQQGRACTGEELEVELDRGLHDARIGGGVGPAEGTGAGVGGGEGVEERVVEEVEGLEAHVHIQVLIDLEDAAERGINIVVVGSTQDVAASVAEGACRNGGGGEGDRVKEGAVAVGGALRDLLAGGEGRAADDIGAIVAHTGERNIAAGGDVVGRTAEDADQGSELPAVGCQPEGPVGELEVAVGNYGGVDDVAIIEAGRRTGCCR